MADPAQKPATCLVNASVDLAFEANCDDVDEAEKYVRRLLKDAFGDNVTIKAVTGAELEID